MCQLFLFKMTRINKNTLVQIFWSLALYLVLLILILMFRHIIITIQIFDPIIRIGPNCLTSRPQDTFHALLSDPAKFGQDRSRTVGTHQLKLQLQV